MRVEKRRNPRDRVNWTVSIQTQVGTLERVAYNIGPDGSFISGLSSLETQEIVGVIVSLQKVVDKSGMRFKRGFLPSVYSFSSVHAILKEQ
jgi:hypothetical protein